MIYRMKNSPSRHHVPTVYMRGGSSKALFFLEKDIPPPGNERDELLKRVMGTPDPLQIDGMGGTKAVTSKVAIVGPSERPDADVDYTFAQVGVKDNAVGYKANCGNISSAVGPFAIEEGLVDEFREGSTADANVRTQAVRIYNTNTEKIITAHVPIDENGAPLEKGNFEMAAVPGTGAPILMDYVGTVGARLQRGILPSGNVVDTLQLQKQSIQVTICDVGNPMVFFNAEDIGMSGCESADELTENEEIIAVTNEIRAKAAYLVGMCDDWTKADEQCPFMPCPIAVTKSTDQQKSHIEARLFLDNMCHESMAGSGAVCIAASSQIEGTIVHNNFGGQPLGGDIFRIGHPVGMMPVFVKTKGKERGEAGETVLETLSFIRTARRIMEGRVFTLKE